MYGVIIQVKIDRDCQHDTRSITDDELVPKARRLPGFVGGSCFRSLKGNGATAVMLFDSEEAACRFAELVRDQGPLAERPAWSLYAIGTYELLAQA